MELVPPMYNVHPYFSLKNVGKKVHYIWQDIKYNIGNGEAKELICMTHGHGQWCGDCLREWVSGWRRTKREKSGQLQ